jgi:plastocyanin
MVPTSLAIASDGTLYVGHLTSAPFTAGTATVIRILPDGTTETVWTGLTMITGLAVGPDDQLYAAQLSEGRDRPPFFVPGTGRIVRQTGLDSGEEVATQLNLPTAIEFGPDGALYVSLPAVGGESGSGQILRVDTSATLPLRGEDFDLATPACLSSTEAVLVKVSDLGFDPSTITIQVGATVTWRNTGEFDHAVASDEGSAIEWDSGVMRPGDEFSITFDQPGTYPYFDGLFPERTATIEVVAGDGADGGGP